MVDQVIDFGRVRFSLVAVFGIEKRDLNTDRLGLQRRRYADALRFSTAPAPKWA